MTPRLLVRHAAAEAAGRPDARIALDSRQAHYLTRVLRLADGAAVEAFNGGGRRWRARLSGERGAAWLVLEAEVDATPESPLEIHLGQCLSSADKMDWTIEKAVELGAKSISPIFSQRSLVRFDQARARRKLEHWQAVVEAACMQSGRDTLPLIAEPVSLEAWLTSVNQPIRLALSPRSSMTLSAWRATLGEADRGPISLLVGPESGLTDTELNASQAAGFAAISLGPRVLRTETAGLAALSALQALLGDF